MEAPIALTVDARLKAAVLHVGGFDTGDRFLSEIDPLNVAAWVRQPVLMINGQYDIIFPLETAQRPMFELLGPDPADKKMCLSPAAPYAPQDSLSARR
jgi:pimeloyl-ACP methyl ester carboxylesterase